MSPSIITNAPHNFMATTTQHINIHETPTQTSLAKSDIHGWTLEDKENYNLVNLSTLESPKNIKVNSKAPPGL